MNTTYILIGSLVLIAAYVMMTYNSLIQLRNRIKEAFAGIDVQLKRRIDLIPNLIETVKGYAKHEKSIFEDVTKARSALMGAHSLHEKADANNMLTDTLKSLIGIAEAYPDLKANENFSQLQRQLEDTEDKIAYARQFYNSNVLDYNNKVETVPSSFIAGMFHFTKNEFFQASEKERENVKVTF